MLVPKLLEPSTTPSTLLPKRTLRPADRPTFRLEVDFYAGDNHYQNRHTINIKDKRSDCVESAQMLKGKRMHSISSRKYQVSGGYGFYFDRKEIEWNAHNLDEGRLWMAYMNMKIRELNKKRDYMKMEKSISITNSISIGFDDEMEQEVKP